MKVLGFAFYVLVVCLAGIGSTVWSSQIEIKWDSRLQFIFFIQNPFSWCQKDSIFKLLLLAVGTRFVKQGRWEMGHDGEIAPLYTSETWALFTGDDGTDEAREVETFFWVWVSTLGERQG